MSGRRLAWTQPCCNVCWAAAHPGVPPVTVVRPLSVHETCVYCGQETSSGIYVRVDPQTAPFPTLTKD